MRECGKSGSVLGDVKPDNLLIAEGGRVRVMDFGLARGMGKHPRSRGEDSIGVAQHVPSDRLDDPPMRHDDSVEVPREHLCGALGRPGAAAPRLLASTPWLPMLADAIMSAMDSSNDDSRGPTYQQVGRKLAALRQVMGFDIPGLAARSRLDAEVIAAVEAGTRPATVDELSDLAFALGVTMTSIVARLSTKWQQTKSTWRASCAV